MRWWASGLSGRFIGLETQRGALTSAEKALTRCLHCSSAQYEGSSQGPSFPSSHQPQNRFSHLETYRNDQPLRPLRPRSSSNSFTFRSLNLHRNSDSSGQAASATGASGTATLDLRSSAASPPPQHSQPQTRVRKPSGKWVAKPRTASMRPRESGHLGPAEPRLPATRSSVRSKRNGAPKRQRRGSSRAGAAEPFTPSEVQLAYEREKEERERPKAQPYPLEIPEEATFSGFLPSILVGERGKAAVIEDQLVRLAGLVNRDGRISQLAENLLSGEYVAVRDDEEKTRMLALAEKITQERATLRFKGTIEEAPGNEISFETLTEDLRKQLTERYVLGKQTALEEPFNTPRLKSALLTAQRTGSYAPEDRTALVSKLKTLLPVAKGPDSSRRKPQAVS